MPRAGRIWLLAALLTVVCAAPAGASTFSSAKPIQFPACLPGDCASLGLAEPYPSTIEVSGLPGNVVSARATLSGIAHSSANDIDVLLVGPGGGKVQLMGAVCGPGPLTGQTFTFDDAAAAPIPIDGPCPSGTYRPNNSPIDTVAFLPPAPGQPYPLALSALNGGPANGSWRLFVLNVGGGGDGVISGWTLELLPSASCAGKPATVASHVGTAGDDTLTGTNGPDVMLGLGGNDTIIGLGGNDVECGGPGRDKLKGGPGRDLLKGQGGKDKLKGQGGNDTCVGGAKLDAAKACEKQKSI